MIRIYIYIYTNILKTGICPDIRKLSYIIPIFKKGDATKAINYRFLTIYRLYRVFHNDQLLVHCYFCPI